MAKTNTFEAVMRELEEILQRMQQDDVSLDESVELYAKAAELVAKCNERLAKAQVQVEEISKQLQEGDA